MQKNLAIGLFDVDPSQAAELTTLLVAHGCHVANINIFEPAANLDVVFFVPDEPRLASFTNHKDDTVWVGVETTFSPSRYSALLESGVHDIIVMENLTKDAITQVLLKAHYRLGAARDIAMLDSQTGALNAEGFMARLEQAIASVDISGRPCGICSLDISKFQKLNEEYGYAVANEVLAMVAQRLSLILGSRIDVGRLGGDEFLLLFEDLSGKEELHQALDIVRASFSARFEVSGLQLSVDAYIGAVIFPESIGSPEELISQAHEAMKTGKRYKQPVFMYDRTATPWFQMDMAAEIRRALREDEFELYYQPRLDLQTGKIVGMEALIRWEHPHYGFIPPTDFIHAAETSGLIMPLGYWILECAERDVLKIEAAGLHGLNIAINLSFKQLQDKAFCANLPDRVKRWKAKHSFLEFELTETAVLDDATQVRETLQEIKDMGVKISLDDFGTGYSALVHVQEFPISTVKIDKSFVQRMDIDRSAQMIVESIIRFAHHLELEVVGEGIETRQHLNNLTRMGCEQGQGYYFSKAIPLRTFIHFSTEVNQDTRAPFTVFSD